MRTRACVRTRIISEYLHANLIRPSTTIIGPEPAPSGPRYQRARAQPGRSLIRGLVARPSAVGEQKAAQRRQTAASHLLAPRRAALRRASPTCDSRRESTFLSIFFLGSFFSTI